MLLKMKCDLLFYLANKTAACQEALAHELGRTGCCISTAAFSTGARELGYALAEAVARTNCVFIVGGLSRVDSQHVLQVLSKALSLPLADGCLQGGRIIANTQGENGCIIESGRQSIIVLPDSPDQLAEMAHDAVTPYLCKKYGLTIRRRFASPQNALPELQTADMPVPFAEADARGKIKAGKKRWRRIGELALLLLLLLLALAGIYFGSDWFGR